MDQHEWVRGSVFRYAGYVWAQEFNPGWQPGCSPRVINEKQLVPFLPKEVPPECWRDLCRRYADGRAAWRPDRNPTAKP